MVGCRDILKRHEAAHERNDLEGKPEAKRRVGRATRACEACAQSKAKCDEERPCKVFFSFTVFGSGACKRCVPSKTRVNSSDMAEFNSPNYEVRGDDFGEHSSSPPWSCHFFRGLTVHRVSANVSELAD